MAGNIILVLIDRDHHATTLLLFKIPDADKANGVTSLSIGSHDSGENDAFERLLSSLTIASDA